MRMMSLPKPITSSCRLMWQLFSFVNWYVWLIGGSTDDGSMGSDRILKKEWHRQRKIHALAKCPLYCFLSWVVRARILFFFLFTICWQTSRFHHSMLMYVLMAVDRLHVQQHSGLSVATPAIMSWPLELRSAVAVFQTTRMDWISKGSQLSHPTKVGVLLSDCQSSTIFLFHLGCCELLLQ